MLSGTPGPGKSKWSSSLALSTSVYSSAITGAGLTPECFGRAVNDIGDFWECASGQRNSVPDSTSGAAPRLEQRSNCASQARLPSNSSLQIARRDGLSDCMREKQEQRLQKPRKTGGAIKVRHDPTIGIARPGKTHLRDPERVQQDSPGRQPWEHPRSNEWSPERAEQTASPFQGWDWKCESPST